VVMVVVAVVKERLSTFIDVLGGVLGGVLQQQTAAAVTYSSRSATRNSTRVQLLVGRVMHHQTYTPTEDSAWLLVWLRCYGCMAAQLSCCCRRATSWTECEVAYKPTAGCNVSLMLTSVWLAVS
jgi:hypothetical protein